MNSVIVTFGRRDRVGSEEKDVLTARDGVARDTLPSEPTAHNAREVMETGLAGAVRVGFVIWDLDSFDRTNLIITNEPNQ
jgi:hypothetical protein